jgi:hypothetical protein
MFVFAQDIRIRNWVKILLASTTLRARPPFSTAKKTWSKVLPILFLKSNPKSNAYPWKKRMPKSNQYFLKYRGWKFGQGNASVCTLDQPPICISSHQGKMSMRKCVRLEGIFYIFFLILISFCLRGSTHASTWMEKIKLNFKNNNFAASAWTENK